VTCLHVKNRGGTVCTRKKYKIDKILKQKELESVEEPIVRAALTRAAS